MGQILCATNGNRLMLVPRSASHTIASAWLLQYEPDNYFLWRSTPLTHPAHFFAVQENLYSLPLNAPLGCVVRNPIERFRSMIAHRNLDINQQLLSPMYAALPKLPYTHYFLFETQLQECANWLGITTPLPHLDETAETDKPALTPEQEAKVREIYSIDILLWESLL